MTGLTIATAVYPLLFGFMTHQSFSPDNRFFTKALEVNVELNWKFVFVFLFVDYFAYQLADVCFIIDTTGVLLYCCLVPWFQFLQPETIKLDGRTGKYLFKNKYGITMTEKELVRLYTEMEIIMSMNNNFFGSLLITQHHAQTLSLSVMSSYLVVKHWEKMSLKDIGSLTIPSAYIIANALEYLETEFVVQSEKISEDFLDSVKKLTKKGGINLKEIRKRLTAWKVLRGVFAYPFYTIDRQNFLEYQNQSVDFLVTLLVM